MYLPQNFNFHVSYLLCFLLNVCVVCSVLLNVAKSCDLWITGIPRDCTSGRMLILQEILHFLFECCVFGTYSNLQRDIVQSHNFTIKK